MEDLRPGTPPVFFVVLGVTITWLLFCIWGVWHTWTRDEKDDQPSHPHWRGLVGKATGRNSKTTRKGVREI